MKTLKVPAISLLLLTVLAVTPALTSPVHAQSGTVCIATPDTFDCQLTPASFTGMTSFTVAVNIDGSDSFNAFDVSLMTDPNLLQPVSNDITGYVFSSGSTLVLANFDDSMGGVARVAAVTLGPATPSPTSGRLFAVTYKVVGTTILGSTIDFLTGCIGTSVDGVCVTVTLGSNARPESIQPATFTGEPEFTVSADPTSLTTGDDITRVTVKSLNGFAGTVSLSAVASPNLSNPPHSRVQP